MTSCADCNSTILFGGKRHDGLRYCDATCLQRGVLTRVADQLPKHDVDIYVANVHRGRCPNCAGEGPVDVHTSHRVYSLILYTSWSSRPTICCRGCGIKRKIGDAVFSVFFGWWGVPWGLFVTPLQIGRNVAGCFRTPDPRMPSRSLEKMLRLNMAANVFQPQERKEPRF